MMCCGECEDVDHMGILRNTGGVCQTGVAQGPILQQIPLHLHQLLQLTKLQCACV